MNLILNNFFLQNEGFASLELMNVGVDTTEDIPTDRIFYCDCKLVPSVDLQRPYRLVDKNNQAFVGPSISYTMICPFDIVTSKVSSTKIFSNIHQESPQECSRNYCLNGGKCVPTSISFR